MCNTLFFFTFQCSLCFRWYNLRMTLARVVIKSALHQLRTEMELALHLRKFKIPKGPFNYYVSLFLGFIEPTTASPTYRQFQYIT